MSEVLTVTRDAGVVDVCLNRPDKKNALSFELFEALIEQGTALAADRSVRAIVLHGAGGNFSAGLDIANFSPESPLLAHAFDRQPASPANFAQRAAWIWKEQPVPVIAAVEGVCFGGALQIALAADIRYATATARLSAMEIMWGIVPDMSATQTLRDLLRHDVAKELVYTGRVVEGTEAQALGLVTEITATPLERARELAAVITRRSPDAIRAAKKLLDAAWHGDPATGLQLEADAQRKLLGSANQMAAVMARFAKREAEFSDPSD